MFAIAPFNYKLFVGGDYVTAGAKVSPFLSQWTKAGYICGDCDGSSEVDIDDVVYLIAYIFSNGPEPQPLKSGNVDCSIDIDIDDVVLVIAYIFANGPAPCDQDGDGIPDC